MPNQLDLAGPVVDLKINCGDDESFTIKKQVDGVYVDYTAASSIKLQVRRMPDDSPLISLSIGAGITVVTTSIYIGVAGALSAAIVPGMYVYDLVAIMNGIVDTIIRGNIEFIPRISQ